MRGKKRDAEEGAGVESGLSHKEKIGNPDLGMGSKGKNEKPTGNPSVGVSRGQTLK
jgi:hypothetical protein